MPFNTTVENNFIGGLNTQTTGMNFPENACVNALNVHVRPWGLIERRLGLDVEPGGFPGASNGNIANNVFTQFVWKDAAGNGNVNITVFQVGVFLFFYNMAAQSISPGFISNINLISFSAGDSGTSIALTPCQFAVGNGYLFVFNSFCNPFYVSYGVTAPNTIAANTINVQFRDISGIDEFFTDNLTDDFRPTAPPTPRHNYNLFNQGWTSTMLTAFEGATSGKDPSNNDTPWMFNVSSTARTFDPTAINAFITATGKAARGHFVLGVLEDRAAVSGLGVSYPANYPTPVGMGQRRFSAGAFWSSRVWYGGVPVQGFNNKIYFSQVALNFDNFGKCFQENDPTAVDLFDLLPTDGGVIVVQEIGTIHKLFPYQNALFIFSNTGVWMVTGSSGVGLGFTADDYTVHKLSSIPSISSNSFVDVYGLPVWWNLTGIYTIVPTQNGFTVQSISDDKIFNFFQTIPTIGKLNARGAFDPVFGIIQWLYENSGATSVTGSQRFNAVLNYNMLSKSFYTWTIPNPNNTIFCCGILYDEMITALVDPRFKYIVINGFNGAGGFISFAEESNITYTDWVGYGVSTNYISTLTTGYKLRGQSDKRFTSLYLTIYLQNQNLSGNQDPRIVANSLNVKGNWDFFIDPASGKLSAIQNIVTINNSPHAIKRVKVRGRGRVIQLDFNSVDGQPMNLEGWTMTEVINKQV